MRSCVRAIGAFLTRSPPLTASRPPSFHPPLAGDLIFNKSISGIWTDWQQGGNQAGMQGGKANPTIWTSAMRDTDRHRVGDNTRGITLARFGGLGNHRYQVGFSGDVASLSWQDMAYQPYFSATASKCAGPRAAFGGWGRTTRRAARAGGWALGSGASASFL
jgi:hypothetical protein